MKPTVDSSALFRALGDPRRARLLELLVAGPASAAVLARQVGGSRAAISYHLVVLSDAGLVHVGHGKAVVRPQALKVLRSYVDQALTAAAVGTRSLRT